VYAFGIDSLVVCHSKQGTQYVAADSRSTGLSRYAKMVTATGDIYIEAALDLPKMLIKLAAKVGQAVIVGGLKDYVPRNLDSIQSIQKSTAMCMAWEG